MTKYTAIFYTEQGECFFPYDQLMFDTKSEAKQWGRNNDRRIGRFAGLRFAGRTLKVDGTKRWPMVVLQGEHADEDINICICGGEFYKQLTVEQVGEDIADALRGDTDKFNEEVGEKP